jgi:hypothetical protein
MIQVSSTKLLWIAFGLLIIGVALPMLMVLQIIESTFFLNFFAFTSSMVGVILGFIGTTQIVIAHRRK